MVADKRSIAFIQQKRTFHRGLFNNSVSYVERCHPAEYQSPRPTRTAAASQSSVQDHKLVVYSHLRKDRSGWVIMDMLKAHAFAWEKNAMYGGACGESLHKHDIQNILDSTSLHKILSFACPPNVTTRNDNHLQRHVLYQGSVYKTDSVKRMASKNWKKDVQRHLHIDDTIKSENVTAVVVHIRQGDVTPCCYPAWYVPNAYFTAMIEKYSRLAKQQVPAKNVKVQIFLQKDSFESWSPFRQYQLHLDSDIGQVWKSILNADYIIGSKSQFSRVPAMFTRGKVVNEHNDWVPYERITESVRQLQRHNNLLSSWPSACASCVVGN
jgi:hypothetical protein